MMMIRILLLLLSLFLNCPNITAQNTWSRKSDFPHWRSNAVAFSIDNFGFVGTGSGSNGFENDIWRYDPESDIWLSFDTMPTVGRVGAICFVINSNAYIGGGVTNAFRNDADREFWKYDPHLNIWTRVADTPFGTYSAETLTAFSIGDCGYAHGSFNDNNFYEYNSGLDTWTKKSNFPGLGKMDQVGFTIGDKGYIGTGFGSNRNTTEFWEYDPKLDKWTQMADFPGMARNGAIGFSIGDLGFIGLGNADGVIVDDIWLYDKSSNIWMEIDNCGFASWNAFSMTIGTRGYFGTGIAESNKAVWEYSPNTSSAKKISKESDIRIFPNPVSDILRIIPRGVNVSSYRIFDSNGRLLRNDMLYNDSINISYLSTGVYILFLYHDTGIITKKFIKN